MKIAIQGGSRFGYKIQTQWIKTRGHQELYGRIMDLSPAVDISYNLPTQRSVQLEEFAELQAKWTSPSNVMLSKKNSS